MLPVSALKSMRVMFATPCYISGVSMNYVASIFSLALDSTHVAEGVPAGMTRKQFETAYTDYPFNPIEHGKTRVSQYADSDGFVEVAEAPTGFMVIKRHVFTAMMKHYPELNYIPDGPPNNPQAHLHWRFFDCMVDPDSGRYLSEDYAFCRRWRDMGGKVWVDLDCKLMHLGQHLFGGDLAESLRVQGRW